MDVLSYFLVQLMVDDDHMPPAFSQEACVLCEDMSIPEGLADGELLPPLLDEPLEPEPDELGMLPPEPPELELPLVPDGLLPEPLPLPVWAATSAGVRATAATRRVNTNFFM